MFRNPLEERGGGRVCDVHNTFFFEKKSPLRALRAHNVRTHYSRTMVVHRVHQRAVCPSWGSPPWGLKTWVIGVVELRKVMKGALRALVHRTIKVVLVVTRRIACLTGSLLFGLKKCAQTLLVSCPLPGGLQWPCPTIPLLSGLRFRGWHGWSMRCCWWHQGSCRGGGGEDEDEYEDEDEDEDEDEEEQLLLAEVLVKGVMEGVGVPPATFCLFDPLLRAPTFHPQTDASSSSVTRRPCGMGSLGWRAAKWAAIQPNQTVVVHWGPFTGRLVQGLALVAVDLRPQEIADGCDGQEVTATTRRFVCRPGLQRQAYCALIPCSTKTANIGA